MATEVDIAWGIMRIAAQQPNGICSFRRARKEIPTHVKLSPANKVPSLKRPGEPMWHQLVRNIKSHDASYKNFIANGLLVHVRRVGYRITNKGRKAI
jgi:hypothetical protein